MLSSSKTDPNYRERWGYAFQWTDKHVPQEEIAKLRAHYDELGSAALEKLQAIVARKKVETKGGPNCPFKPELYTVLKEHYHEAEVLQKFWDELHSVPDWVDWEQIERAQKFFARYALANSTAFALQGFIRENSVILHILLSILCTDWVVGLPRNRRSIRSHWWLRYQEPAVTGHRDIHLGHPSHNFSREHSTWR